MFFSAKIASLKRFNYFFRYEGPSDFGYVPPVNKGKNSYTINRESKAYHETEIDEKQSQEKTASSYCNAGLDTVGETLQNEYWATEKEVNDETEQSSLESAAIN